MKIDRTNATKGSGRLDVVTEVYLDYTPGETIFERWSSTPFANSITPYRSCRTRFTLQAEKLTKFRIRTSSWFPRGGSYVVVVDPKDPREAPNHINALLIERATLLDGQKPRRSRKH
ncbi:MAG: hypothetical protein DMF11_08270 [Verrucomicrobia bacterium]|nr:MAG: hypothetical protein DMF11_08270 [Verrucomicrobiota bacterium]